MKHLLSILVLLSLPLASAVTIDTIYYDALDESGSEFILLRNGNDTISIEGWRIATPASQRDATLQGSLAPHATYLIADTGWNESRDDPAWPAADHEETLTLANNDGYVQLLNAQGQAISTVGYGNTNISEGTPHPGAAEGEALVRTQDTGDNAADFIAQAPTFNPQDDESTAIGVTVTNTPPTLIDLYIEDDDSLTEGTQLLPLPGGERRVTINATIQDNNSLAEVTVLANGEPLIGPAQGTKGTFTGSVAITTSTTTLQITVSDENSTTTHNHSIELLPVVGLKVPHSIDLTAAPGSLVQRTLTVENTGTTNLSLQIKGVRPSLGELLLGEVFYTLQGTEYPLLESFREHTTALAPGEHQQIALTITTGHVPSGTYSGQILIAGVQA